MIAGLRQAYFKSLGTAAALMNDAFLPLPDWFAIQTEEDANAYLSIIDEVSAKGGCLKSLQEKHSDDGHVLQQYREWLLSGELTDLLEFHYLFALAPEKQKRVLVVSRKDWARPFGTENLSTLLTRAYEEKYQTDRRLSRTQCDHQQQPPPAPCRQRPPPYSCPPPPPPPSCGPFYALTLPNPPARGALRNCPEMEAEDEEAGNEEFAATVASDYLFRSITGGNGASA